MTLVIDFNEQQGPHWLSEHPAHERRLAEIRRQIVQGKRGRINALKGGQGSGNFGHEGRPGEVGGSGGGGALEALTSPHGTAGLMKNQVEKLTEELARNVHNHDFGDDRVCKLNDEGQMVAGDGTRALAKSMVADEIGKRMEGKCTPEEAVGLIRGLRQYETSSTVDAYGRAAAAVVDQWHHTSGDSSYQSLAIQQRVAEVMGLKGHWMPEMVDPLTKEQTPIFAERHKNAIDAFIRATYENTQAQLKADGIDKVTLYRGMQVDEFDKLHKEIDKAEENREGHQAIIGLGAAGRAATVFDNVNLQQMPVSSYSTDIHKSWQFGRPSDNVHSGVLGLVVGTVVPRSQIFSTASTGPGCLIENEVLVMHKSGTEGKVFVFESGATGDPFMGNPEWAGHQFWKETGPP